MIKHIISMMTLHDPIGFDGLLNTIHSHSHLLIENLRSNQRKQTMRNGNLKKEGKQLISTVSIPGKNFRFPKGF